MLTILAGGTGGAKLARGFAAFLPPLEMNIIVNTGDDYSFYGLQVSPDVDMVIYLLAGLLDENRGWGLRDETFTIVELLNNSGEDVWFNLGDKDLVNQLKRLQFYTQGGTPTEFAKILTRNLGVKATVLPMTDQHVETRIVTESGNRHFEEYLLADQCRGNINEILFQGIESARPTAEVLNAIRTSRLIVFGPSNPLVSIGPILALPGFKEALRDSRALKVAVSPIIGGKALKGPLAGMLQKLNLEVSSFGVAGFYQDIADIFFIDEEDAGLAENISLHYGLQVITGDIRMPGAEREKALAQSLYQLLSR